MGAKTWHGGEGGPSSQVTATAFVSLFVFVHTCICICIRKILVSKVVAKSWQEEKVPGRNSIKYKYFSRPLSIFDIFV